MSLLTAAAPFPISLASSRSRRLQSVRHRRFGGGVEDVQIGRGRIVANLFARLGGDRLMGHRDEQLAGDVHRKMALIAEPLVGDDARLVETAPEADRMRADADDGSLPPADRLANRERDFGGGEV